MGESPVTSFVLIGNEAVVWLAPMITVGGTVAMAVLLLFKAAVMPPAGAALASVIVPVDALPPIRR